jgi:hypothetical protein
MTEYGKQQRGEDLRRRLIPKASPRSPSAQTSIIGQVGWLDAYALCATVAEPVNTRHIHRAQRAQMFS